MHVGKLEIGRHRPPVFLAELSGNHNGDLDRALAVIDAMADAGAHAIKLQTYTADTMTIDVDRPDFMVGQESELWAGHTLHELYEIAHTPWEWHEALFERAAARGMECLSTPFDVTAVDFLESLDAPAYKVASFESTDHALVRRIAETGKPMIISTGMSSLAEIAETVEVARDAGCEELMLLKCTSAYPSSPTDSHLATIPHLREAFSCEVGLSDHTLGIAVPVAAVTLGATLIEKHVTLRRADGGVDSAFSLEPDEVRRLVEQTEIARQALGHVQYDPVESEKKSLRFRRSLYVVEDVAAGEAFTAPMSGRSGPGSASPPSTSQPCWAAPRPTGSNGVRRWAGTCWPDSGSRLAAAGIGQTVQRWTSTARPFSSPVAPARSATPSWTSCWRDGPTPSSGCCPRDELKQHEMRIRVDSGQVRYFIGDIRDRDRLTRAAQGADIIVHAAAMKQVPACEYNPMEAVATNVLGAQNIVDSAIDAGVEQVVALSTDKAVNPVNLYGATKLCEEKIIVQGNAYAAQSNTRLSCVRYGNVVGSRGSVVPVFRQQLAETDGSPSPTSG